MSDGLPAVRVQEYKRSASGRTGTSKHSLAHYLFRDECDAASVINFPPFRRIAISPLFAQGKIAAVDESDRCSLLPRKSPLLSAFAWVGNCGVVWLFWHDGILTLESLLLRAGKLPNDERVQSDPRAGCIRPVTTSGPPGDARYRAVWSLDQFDIRRVVLHFQQVLHLRFSCQKRSGAALRPRHRDGNR